jgi:hypothetical protein
MRTKGAVAEKKLSTDLRKLAYIVKNVPELGASKREPLLDAIENPTIETFRQAMALIDREFTRLEITRGRHHIARLFLFMDYLDRESLKFILDRYRTLKSEGAYDDDGPEKW